MNIDFLSRSSDGLLRGSDRQPFEQYVAAFKQRESAVQARSNDVMTPWQL